MSNLIYNSTGTILRTVIAPPDMLEMQIQQGEFLLAGAVGNYHTQYVLDEVVIDRPIQATTLNKLTLNADGVDSVAITNSPLGDFRAVNVFTKEAVSGVINGTNSFSTTIKGVYKITILSFPYLDFEATIEAI